jgi:hypothetical protein
MNISACCEEGKGVSSGDIDLRPIDQLMQASSQPVTDVKGMKAEILG